MSIIQDGFNKKIETLHDVSKTGKERPFAVKKRRSLVVSKSYARLSEQKYLHDDRFDRYALKMRDCGSFLEFKRFFADGSLKLHNANFCKLRLCPMCQWRRSLKMYSQMIAMMGEAVKRHPGAHYIFVTYTVRNVAGAELSSTIDKMQNAYRRMLHYKQMKKAVVGGLRVLEVTRNRRIASENYGTYHPHFHCIYMVYPDYFESDRYNSTAEWVKLWKKALAAEGYTQDVDPICDAKKIAPSDLNIEKAVAEVSKYPVKDSDIIGDNDGFLDDGIETLHYALKGRRMTSFHGSFREIRRDLQLDDAEDGDLVHTEVEPDLNDDELYEIVSYVWNYGFMDFILSTSTESDGDNIRDRGGGRRLART